MYLNLILKELNCNLSFKISRKGAKFAKNCYNKSLHFSAPLREKNNTL